MNLNDYTLNKPDEGCLSSSELSNLEKSCKREFTKLFKERKLSVDDTKSFEKFLYRKKLSEEVKESVYVIRNTVRYCVTGRRIITLLSRLKGKGILYERGIVVLTILREWHGILELCFLNYTKEKEEDSSIEEIFDILEKYKVPIIYRLNLIDDLMSKDCYGGKKSSMMDNIIKNLITCYKEDISKNIKELSPEGRVFILECIWKEKNEENLSILLDNFGDTSKQVRNKVADLLKESPEYFYIIKNKLTSKSSAEREVAINIMLQWKTKEAVEVLKHISKIEKQQKLSNLIINALKETSNIIEEKLSIKDLIKHLLSISQSKKSTLEWIDLKSMPEIRFKNKKHEDKKSSMAEYCDYKYKQSLLLCYSATNLIGMSRDGNRLADKLNKNDLACFANKLLELWIEDKCKADRKWVLAFSCIYGDMKTINKVKRGIKIWSDELRWNTAKDGIYSLMLSGKAEALIIVDTIEKKCKYKQIKKCAHEAWDFAAKEMNINKEILFDMSVPDLGFDADNKVTFDYGSRKFNVILTKNMELEIYEYDKNRKLKALPAPSKNDESEKAQSAYRDYKLLKKQLAVIIEMQYVRLEEVLESGRKWDKSQWMRIFEDNPVMRRIGESLIWGAYDGEELQYTFSIIDNRECEEENEIVEDDDNKYNDDNYKIGLIHPFELEEDEINVWKEEFEKYDVVPKIQQLNRIIFEPEKDSMDSYSEQRFSNKTLNSEEFIKDMMSHGWVKGSISEGRYYNFYKKYDSYNLAAELNFDGVCLSGINGSVEIEDLRFYKISEDTCRENIAEEIEDENVLKLKEVPKRIFSETMYQINRILE